jgi:hypothetical protein
MTAFLLLPSRAATAPDVSPTHTPFLRTSSSACVQDGPFRLPRSPSREMRFSTADIDLLRRAASHAADRLPCCRRSRSSCSAVHQRLLSLPLPQPRPSLCDLALMPSDVRCSAAPISSKARPAARICRITSSSRGVYLARCMVGSPGCLRLIAARPSSTSRLCASPFRTLRSLSAPAAWQSPPPSCAVPAGAGCPPPQPSTGPGAAT